MLKGRGYVINETFKKRNVENNAVLAVQDVPSTQPQNIYLSPPSPAANNNTQQQQSTSFFQKKKIAMPPTPRKVSTGVTNNILASIKNDLQTNIEEDIEETCMDEDKDKINEDNFENCLNNKSKVYGKPQLTLTTSKTDDNKSAASKQNTVDNDERKVI
jgi:alpha-mannosidase